MKKVIRMLWIDGEQFSCVDDILTLNGNYNGIYFNENKPWFHLKECVINQGCVANWREPLTDESCERWVIEGAPTSIVYWKEFVACATENLYVKIKDSGMK